jgi:hypothetical protein
VKYILTMPYFPEHNILFIHIPKTGGTSIEHVLGKNSKKELYCAAYSNNVIPNKEFQKISLQHQFYSTIKRYQSECKVPFDDKLKIITVVRNPYERIISDLLWLKLVNKNSTPDEVYKAIKKFVGAHGSVYDNHNIPQHKFLLNDKGKIPDKIKIFHTETLNEEFEKELNIKLDERVLSSGISSYDKYYNKLSIDLVNRVYHNDFEIFKYKKK